jgi:hypothetical protein
MPKMRRQRTQPRIRRPIKQVAPFLIKLKLNIFLKKYVLTNQIRLLKDINFYFFLIGMDDLIREDISEILRLL